MTVELTSKIVRCRKQHKCEWCGETIQRAEQASYRTGIFDGFYAYHMHLECDDACSRSEGIGEEGFMPHEQERGKIWQEMDK